jgi:hypothetical protein
MAPKTTIELPDVLMLAGSETIDGDGHTFYGAELVNCLDSHARMC